MDISRSEQVESDLDRLIKRRDAQRRKTEGERLEELIAHHEEQARKLLEANETEGAA